MASIRTWMQRTEIEIVEVDFDGDAHAFEIYVDGRRITTVYADTPEQTEDMRAGLDAGEDVKDWEDGNGNSVGTLIAERTGDGLRETLKRLEDEGMCHTDEFDGCIVWVDEVNGVKTDIDYVYETDKLYFRVNDLTDEDLKNVIIRGH